MPRTKINKIVAYKSDQVPNKRGRKTHTLNEKLQSLMRSKPKATDEDDDVLYDNEVIQLDQDKPEDQGKDLKPSKEVEIKQEIKQPPLITQNPIDGYYEILIKKAVEEQMSTLLKQKEARRIEKQKEKEALQLEKKKEREELIQLITNREAQVKQTMNKQYQADIYKLRRNQFGF
jgi:hypothetical protein